MLETGVRLASEAVASDTDIAQALGRITWLIPQGERGRIKLRGEVGAMTVGDFDALPPELRFFAGGDRSMRGFDYHEIGEVNAQWQRHRRKIPRDRAARSMSTTSTKTGARRVFVDAGDAFTTRFSLNVGAGVGLRWHSPLGPDPCGRRVSGADRAAGHELVAAARAAGAGHMRRLVKVECVVADRVARCSSGGFASWLLFTTSGARWVTGTVTARFAPQVRYARIDGTIAGELTITDFRFEGGADSARIRIQSMRVDPTLMMLFSRALRIDHARVQGLTVILPPAKDEPEPDKPLWIEPPLDVTVKDFQLADATIYRQNEKLVTIRQVGLSARWKARELIVESLAVHPGDIEGDLDGVGAHHS